MDAAAHAAVFTLRIPRVWFDKQLIFIVNFS